MRNPTIICAQCQAPVDSWEWFDDRKHWNLRVIRAYCHGAVDEMSINMETISSETLAQLKNATGVAFATKALSGGGE